jgi:ArsR family metal-binding transcriptional regulator
MQGGGREYYAAAGLATHAYCAAAPGNDKIGTMGELIDKYEVSISVPACTPGSSRWGGLAVLEDDISLALPYLNAVWDGCRYDRANEVLLRDTGDQKYAFRPREIRVAFVRNLADAQNIVADMVSEINRIWRQRDGITPDHSEKVFPPVLGLYRRLPGTNCRRCGYATCMAFAADLSRGKCRPEQCPPLNEAAWAEALAGLREMTAGL